MTPEFVISLDFELLWGVRDHADRERYGANVLGARQAIPRVLELFERHGIQATWATVGFLFAENKDELLTSLPAEEERPTYANPALSNYRYIDEVGVDEASDPYYFGMSLIRRIVETPGQEIGTHTLSHYYCLEPGQTPPMFEADLRAAIAMAARRGIVLQSIVFPRNQYEPTHLDICRRNGITAWRGNPEVWAYYPGSETEQTLPRRALRLIDAHTGVLGRHGYPIEDGAPRNVPASMFLRPKAGRLAPFHPFHIRTICRAMTETARRNQGYHLWWHPHNFGINTQENLSALSQVLSTFVELCNEYGMVSRSMGLSGRSTRHL